MSECFALFETAIGTAAIAWTDAGVSGVELPEPDAAALRRRFRRRHPRAIEARPPAEIERTVQTITELLRGEAGDLADVQLDLGAVPPFERQVYSIARGVPAGGTISYGQIATRLGDVHLAREVGQALARNPFPIVVPCHRVIAANGKLGGFSARGGLAAKRRLLALERADVAWQLPLET
jgi:methylated-DNA-[protein]-cysteine S-methyltransferase